MIRLPAVLVTLLLFGLTAPATATQPAPAALVTGPVAGSASGPAAVVVFAPPGMAAGSRSMRLGGVAVRARSATRQVITVNATSGYRAVVSLWSRRAGGWRRQATTTAGRIGYGGPVPGRERQQGTGTTPLGTYSITETFGNGAATRGTRLPFHRVRRGDYWVQDNRSRFYNDRRHISRGGFRPATSEHLPDYGAQYRWSLVIDFNRPRPVRHRGAGIFLHVNGPGATAGCVSAPKRFVKAMMNRLHPDARPVIAIGR